MLQGIPEAPASHPSYRAGMDPLAELRAKIPAFPGYATEDDRRRGDELVRSYLGEALALLRARLADLPEPGAARLGDLILRAGFRNQLAFKVFEYATLDGAKVDRVTRNDLRMIGLADRAANVDAVGLTAFLDEVVQAFDVRDHEMQTPEAAA